MVGHAVHCAPLNATVMHSMTYKKVRSSGTGGKQHGIELQSFQELLSESSVILAVDVTITIGITEQAEEGIDGLFSENVIVQ